MAGKQTYGQILKSSSLIGGSTAINMLLGIVRVKAMALILGPGGFALLGLYTYISDLTRNVAGLGINSSGVRQIAESVGTGDSQRIARTVIALRRVALASGIFGAVLLLALCRPISWITFEDYGHAGAVALLALAVFFGAVSQGQMALVQGMRRIADLARISVLGALSGLLFSVPIVYFYRLEGVVPALICVAGMGVLTSWWYASKVRVERVPMNRGQFAQETAGLLKLGVVFMSSSLMVLGAAYVVQIIVLRKLGLDAAGYYQSAWNLGGLSMAIVLQGMAADFYPRLTAVANENPECNRLVNEQTEVGLLLAGPGIIGALTFAPTLILVFYSAKFGPAVEVLRWICLGMFLRVASWPLGYVLIAKGARGLYFWSELASNSLFVALVLAGVSRFGLDGAGMAFFVMYVVYLAGMYLLVRHLTGLRWSAANVRLVLLLAPLTAAVFASKYFLPAPAPIVLGTIVTLLSGFYSARVLCRLIPLDRLPRLARRALQLLRLTPRASQTPAS